MSTLEHRHDETPIGLDDQILVELDELSWTESVESGDPVVAAGEPTRPRHPAAQRPAALPPSNDAEAGVAAALVGAAGRLYRSVSAAHATALAAHQALQLLVVKQWAAGGPTPAAAAFASPGTVPNAPRHFDIVGQELIARPGPSARSRTWPARRTAFKPLARSARTSLDAADLASLSRGDIAVAFGAPYAQPGYNQRVVLATAGPLLLTSVDRIDCRGGSAELGALDAQCQPAGTGLDDDGAQHRLAAASQAVEVLALYLGLHLCFADCDLAAGLPEGAVADGPPPATLHVGTDRPTASMRVEIVSVDLVPLPWLAADVTFVDADGAVTGRIHGLGLHARPRSGALLGPTTGGTVPEFLGRFNKSGEPAMLSEFNITHIAHGDQAIAMGPEFGTFSDVPAVRLPSGELLLVDRVMSLTGRRGDVHAESRWRTEYDSPADSWYYRESANAGMPNCVFMEFSLQAAAFLGPYLGGTLLGDGAEPLRLRNLEGQATLLRDVDLRDQTISQASSITSTSITPGALLQEFAYESSISGQPFYRGTSLFGYFDSDALENQVGLDGGRLVPTWLQANPTAASRTVDVAARRVTPGRVACSVGRLALIDTFDVVDAGGRAGLGYLHGVQDVDPAAWYFDRHFYLDPVIPGSFGVETIIQAIQEWIVDTGLDQEIDRPEFVVPVGSTLSWKYRGQFLRSDGPMTFEVHVTGVERRPGRVRVSAEASVWKPGMRIYAIERVCVELRDADAPPW